MQGFVGITAIDFLQASVLAFFLTWFIISVTNFRKLIKRNAFELDYLSKDINAILQKCYKLFPMDIVTFRGQTYRRGASIRVTTVQQKIFEGELIGLNSNHMLCLLTKKYIIAHELDNIEDITVINK